ncbi:MAG: leucine-rich repeat domain-containing protein, partial [Clostridia bacterium]|nr:leucine-rich repeat domain-containing protein [Clostridia bacterium]
VSAFGKTFSLADEVVSLNDVPMKDQLDALRTLLPYLRNVKRLDMENCGIADSVMAELREAFPTPKIVWRVSVGRYSCRTDSIMIRFSLDIDKRRLYDRDTEALKYCNEVRYLDLGHNRIQKMRFLEYMPDLEVLIIAVGDMNDITGVEHCKKLEYCEFLSGHVSDLSPLAACTELKHLNVSLNSITDITPLYGLTKLERLWISRNKIPEEQIEEIRRLLPNCEINTTAIDPTGEGWRYSNEARGTRCERYDLLHHQFYYNLGILSYTEETRPTSYD